MINWSAKNITIPPPFLTSDISEKKSLIKYIKLNNVPAITLKKLPICNIQAVERCVKLVSEAAGAVCGKKQRDGFIHT